MVHETTSQTFQTDVLDSSVPVLVDFWAVWCGPCRMMLKTIEELDKESNGKYKVVKVDVDESTELAGHYNVTGLPCLVLFKGGTEVYRMIGAHSKSSILSVLASHV